MDKSVPSSAKQHREITTIITVLMSQLEHDTAVHLKFSVFGLMARRLIQL